MSPEGTKRRTTDELRELVKSVRSGTFHYDGRQKRSLDWASYNEAQLNEVNDMLNLMKRFVNIASSRVPERPRRRGRPPFPARDVAKALLLQSYFGVSDRVAAGLVKLFKEKLGIANEFSYKTIERGYDPSPVSEILQEVFRLTNEYGNSKETTFSVDGTGEPTSSKVNYESVRSEQRTKEEDSAGSWPSSSRHDFQYMVSSVGVHTKIIGGFKSTGDHSVGELSMFPSVLSQTRINCPGMDTVVGDALYTTRNDCAMVVQCGARPYFFPHINSIFMSHGVPSWKEMMYGFVEDPQGWLQTYHMRSISETVNAMDKTRFPWKIRRRIPHRRDAAGSLRVCVHNIRRCVYMVYVQPEFISPIRN